MEMMNRRKFIWIIWWGALSSFFSEVLTAELLNEHKEVSTEKIAELTATGFLRFGRERLGKKVDENQGEIYPLLYNHFLNYPLCSIQDGKIAFLLTSEGADSLAQTLMPSFMNVYGKLLIRAIHTLKGDDNKIRSNFITETKAEKNLEKVKKRYLRDFGVLCYQLSTLFIEEMKKLWLPYEEVTSEDFLEFIIGVFHNATLDQHKKTLAKEKATLYELVKEYLPDTKTK